MIFGDEVGDDSLAVADRLAIVSDVGELPARSYGDGGRGPGRPRISAPRRPLP